MPSRERASVSRSAARVTVSESSRFFNRETQLQEGVAQVSALIRRPDHFSVLEVVGPGGAGKTRLLQELRDSALERASSPGRVIWVPLGAEAVSSEAGPLLRIRNRLGFDCLLHDTALLTYWKETGQPLRLEASNPLANSIPVRFLQEGGKAAGLPLPLTFGFDLFQHAKTRWAKASRYDGEEFEVIDQLRDTPEEILRRLPEFLGLDIMRVLDPNEELIAFYDGYEKQKATTIAKRSPWLRTFLRTLHCGVHVISSREPLWWDESEWGEVIQPIAIGPLPREQSLELIRSRLGTLDGALVERMLETSRCLPFFLEAVVKGYRPGEGRSGSSLSVGDDPLDHLLDHLGKSQQDLAVTMASVQLFDRELFEHLARELSLGVAVFDFDEFITSFYVEEFPPSLHKTHDLLTEFVRDANSARTRRRRALQVASEHLPVRCLRDGLGKAEVLLSLLAATVSGWYSLPDPPKTAVESLIDAGYMLYDAGYWNEIGSLPLAPDADHPVSVAAEFLAALAARRTDDVDRARELLAALAGRVSGLGRHQDSFELETAYLTELGGDYESARRQLLDLEGRITRFDPTSRLHVRSRLYLADMQIMDGELKRGARLLLKSYEAELISDLDWAELVRHRGHAFRFSFLFETAVDLYGKAMRVAEERELGSLQAKLHTNLAEARCWSEPALALEDAENSADLNGRLGNGIELAKCAAAKAIALAKLDRFGEAAEAIASARQYAKHTRYPAAAAFALQAQAISLGLQDKDDAAADSRQQLERALATLDTYPHLAVAAACAGGEQEEFERRIGSVEWQQPEDAAARIRRYVNAS